VSESQNGGSSVLRNAKAQTFTGVVALDGPSGTGKSTVARRLAIRLNARYLDTGAMYRAATVAVLRAGAAIDDPDDVLRIAGSARIAVSTDPGAPGITVNGISVDEQIRSGEVTAAVSAVAAVSALRDRLVAQQREIIGAGGIIVEGRDIGSVVWPLARPKVFLTATASARALRRAGELGASAQVHTVAADIDRRDQLDSTRAASPLAQAVDAVVVDTTHLEIDEVVQRLVDLVWNGSRSAGVAADPMLPPDRAE
jgi:cytidylate kinase